uniref:G protein-coupled receptor n=1 Tax=Plectus sambesii TaxID=2011161 RepID=A0A914VHA1_9BILA
MCSFKYSDRDCEWCEQLVVYGSYISYSVSFFYSALLFHHLYVAFRRVSDVNSSRRLKDEVGILLCIVIQTALPILLTIPMNSRQYMWRLGFGRVGTAFAATLYNYSPLFDAISIIAFVKPYRRAAKRLWRSRAETEAGPRRVLQECCET